MSQELVLIRGLPGSGKSTLARTEYVPRGYVVYEADDYFLDPETDIYRFDRDKLKQAHDDCYTRTCRALRNGYSVVVSNTFTQHWEMEPYRDAARGLGVPLTIRTATGSYPNVHGVPAAAIERMRARWQP